MALRNFWVSARIDGRETELEGGPRAKDGGMSITVLQRDNGSKTKAVQVNCWEADGKLYTRVEINGVHVGTFDTRR